MSKRQAKSDVARDPYVRIVIARRSGKGVHLSVDEAFAMSFDSAIETRASNILVANGYEILPDGRLAEHADYVEGDEDDMP